MNTLSYPLSRQFNPLSATVILVSVGLSAWILSQASMSKSGLFAIALLMGIALYHASYGFSAAYRNFFIRRETTGIDSQIILIALTTLFFAPALIQGEAFDQPVGGAVAPVGLGMAFGAFIFGIGMQLGGACASGSLYTAGSGNPRMMIVLLFFCAGAFWGSLDLLWWQSLPAFESMSLASELGWEAALPLQLTFLAGLYLWLGRFRKKKEEGADREPTLWKRCLRGPWPLLWGAVALAFLNWLTLINAGHPWSITWGFTLWGAKAATFIGWDPASSDFWSGAFQAEALDLPIWQDTTSVMNIGILAGATAAMILSGRRQGKWNRKIKPLIAAVLGGLLLGYGARLAYGCNIGAFVSGVASTSLHGWIWIICALPGNWIGMKLRPWFDLQNAQKSG